MDQDFPLTYLAQMVARALSQDYPTRLAVRNSDRLGLVHLYFAHGHLMGVAGHIASPLALLGDLATWRWGTIRRDEGAAFAWPGADEGGVDPALAPALTKAIRALETNGVTTPPAIGSGPLAQPGGSGPLALGHSTPARFTSSSLPPYQQTTEQLSLPPTAQELSHLERVAGLPSLAHAVMPPEPPASVRHGHASPPGGQPQGGGGDLLTAPQWQMIALIIRQVVEHAAEQIGTQLAENLLRQSLGQTATLKEPFRLVEVDASGWLHAMAVADGRAITHYSTAQVADAVAALLTTFETRCSSLVGPAQAHQIIISATAPFRTSLTQLGLTVADGVPPGSR